MSIKQAQQWLNQRPNIGQSLYAVMVQYEIGEDTEYQLINTGGLGLYPTPLIGNAVWRGYLSTYNTAKQLIRKTIFTGNDKYEITRAFIVEKGEDYRVIEEVDIDAPEPDSPTS
ncbi:hypothetical protein PQG67_07050 [Corynebacterium pseudodiphtheriticum]|uniref:hypothetical protein n=1 Tax=Corynebacterium pseudodiphtheriticum TaxID=37637 RepID=UPI00234D8055|nr:hypothetical protein [Corynebacterium pseudodiphtheriticum]MDC7086705.1 hypothetical protein [Corynebacterium pseudodiphtheriticum]